MTKARSSGHRTATARPTLDEDIPADEQPLDAEPAKQAAPEQPEEVAQATDPTAPARAEGSGAAAWDAPTVIERPAPTSETCVNCGEPAVYVSPADGAAAQVAFCARHKPANAR